MGKNIYITIRSNPEIDKVEQKSRRASSATTQNAAASAKKVRRAAASQPSPSCSGPLTKWLEWWGQKWLLRMWPAASSIGSLTGKDAM